MEAELQRYHWHHSEMMAAQDGDYFDADQAERIIETLEARVMELEDECNALSDQVTELEDN